MKSFISFIHLQKAFNLGQRHGGSSVYSRNTGCEMGLHPEYTQSIAGMHTLIHTWWQFHVANPLNDILFRVDGGNQRIWRKPVLTQEEHIAYTVTSAKDQTPLAGKQQIKCRDINPQHHCAIIKRLFLCLLEKKSFL